MASTATPETCQKGSELVLYYNTGTEDTPTWVEHVGVINDLSLNETEELQELTGRRIGRLVKEYNEGEMELSISGEQLVDPEYEGWQFLNSMRTGGISREVMCLTGPVTVVGSYGWRGDFRSSDRTINGPASGSMTSPVNLQPAAQCHADWSECRVVKIIDVSTVATLQDFDPTTYEASA